ncbi:MAG: beta-lactamase superfamily II metal-dependent hydrolase [Halopseudomonas sp.]|jgi:beta-lactamase superfamily II metal-dependent hydrolase
MQGTGPDNNQQTIIVSVQYCANSVALLGDLPVQSGAAWKPLAQLRGAGEW